MTHTWLWGSSYTLELININYSNNKGTGLSCQGWYLYSPSCACRSWASALWSRPLFYGEGEELTSGWTLTSEYIIRIRVANVAKQVFVLVHSTFLVCFPFSNVNNVILNSHFPMFPLRGPDCLRPVHHLPSDTLAIDAALPDKQVSMHSISKNIISKWWKPICKGFIV